MPRPRASLGVSSEPALEAGTQSLTILATERGFRAIDRAPEPMVTEWLHEIFERMELERAHGVLIVRGDEDDERHRLGPDLGDDVGGHVRSRPLDRLEGEAVVAAVDVISSWTAPSIAGDTLLVRNRSMIAAYRLR